MRYLWDIDKARLNQEKHGVSFEEAAELLQGSFAFVQSNINHEQRIKAVARNRGEYFTIIYAPRDSAIRIISARHASEKERKFYDRNHD